MKFLQPGKPNLWSAWIVAAMALGVVGVVSAFVFVRWSTVGLVFLVTAGMAASVHASVVAAENPLDRATMELVVKWATSVGAVTVALSGYVAAVGLMTAPLLVVLAVTGLRILPTARRANVDRLVLDASSESLADTSDEELCLLWRRSAEALQAQENAVGRQLVLALRERCLDELERRSPQAFTAWMAATSRTDAESADYYLPSGRLDVRARAGRWVVLPIPPYWRTSQGRCTLDLWRPAGASAAGRRGWRSVWRGFCG